MISLKQINYALAVERTLHFKKAADFCSISPSALSTSLTELEKTLGFQIFERDNKKVLITRIGQEFLDKSREIQILMKQIDDLSDSKSKPLSGPLSIGIIPTISPFLLPIILPALKQNYPDLELEIFEEQSHVIVDSVKKGDIDCAIIALPYQVDGLLSFKFWQENFYWLTISDDQNSTLNKISAHDIDSEKLMLLKDGHCLKDHALAACKLDTISSHNLSATSLTTLVQLVAGNMGTTLIPEMAVQSLIRNNPNLKLIELEDKGPHREIAFVVRPNYNGLKNIELMMDLFKKEMTEIITPETH